MIWRRRKTQPLASAAAIHALADAHSELKEAKALRAEAAEVGASLRRSHEQNHFGLSLERAIQGVP